MKSKKIIIGFICVGLTLLVSCSNNTKTTTNTKNENDKNDSSINSDNTNKNIADDNSNKTTDNKSENKYTTSSEKIKLLDNIKSRASNGMIVNCDFKVKENIMTNVRDVFGPEDKIDNVPDAKGNY